MFLEKIPVRLRLALGHAIWMALLFVTLGIGIYKLVEHNLNQSVDAALISSAESLRNARKAIAFRSPFNQSFLREFFGEDYVRPYAQLVDLSGKVSAKTQNVRVSLPVSALAIERAERGLATLETVQRHDFPPLRQITLPVIQNQKFTGELVQVGAPLDPIYSTLRTTGLMLWTVLPLGLLASIIFGYFWMAWSLRPVAAITKAAASLGSEDLTLRLPLPLARDEIRDLSSTFNGMLDRLQDAFGRVKRFAGDVSHELRTPLTVLRGEAEFALRRERTSDEYKRTLSVIAKEAINMSSIVEDLLLLARAQSKSVAMTWDDIDSEELSEIIRDSTKQIYEQRSLKLIIESPALVTFKGSLSYLVIALKNILLNAAKHSPVGAEVKLRIFSDEHSVRFTIVDQGEGIPKESLPFIFDTFYRADTARNRAAGGSGIGLSLTLALVQLHGGKIEVKSEDSKGAQFDICIPRKRLQTEETKPGLLQTPIPSETLLTDR